MFRKTQFDAGMEERVFSRMCPTNPTFSEMNFKTFLKPKQAGRCNILEEVKRYVTDHL